MFFLLIPAFLACNKDHKPCPPCPNVVPAQPCATCCKGEPDSLYSSPQPLSDTSGSAQSDLAIDRAATGVTPEVSASVSTWHLRARVVDLAHDDCAHCVRVFIGLPAEVKVLSFSANGDRTTNLPWRQCLSEHNNAASITVESLNYLCSDTSAKAADDRFIDIDCVVTQSTNVHAAPGAAFSVYATSSVADPDPSNNYWYWTKAGGPSRP